jgi:hypothetical protein
MNIITEIHLDMCINIKTLEEVHMYFSDVSNAPLPRNFMLHTNIIIIYLA